MIPIKHAGITYDLLIVETQPNNASVVSLLDLEADLKFDLIFDSIVKKSFNINDLLNKKDVDTLKDYFKSNIKVKRGQPYYDYSIGLIRLNRRI